MSVKYGYDSITLPNTRVLLGAISTRCPSFVCLEYDLSKYQNVGNTVPNTPSGYSVLLDTQDHAHGDLRSLIGFDFATCSCLTWCLVQDGTGPLLREYDKTSQDKCRSLFFLTAAVTCASLVNNREALVCQAVEGGGVAGFLSLW